MLVDVHTHITDKKFDEDDKTIVILNSLNYQDELKKDRFLSME